MKIKTIVKKKVIIETFSNRHDLEGFLNRMYNRNDMKILDVQFSTSSNDVCINYSCMITYEEIEIKEEGE